MKFRNVAIVVGLFVAMLFSQSLKAAQNSPFANSNNLALHFKDKLSKVWNNPYSSNGDTSHGEIKSTNVIVCGNFATASMTVLSGSNNPQPRYSTWIVKFKFILNFGKWELENYSVRDAAGLYSDCASAPAWQAYGKYLISDLPLNKE